MKLILNLAKKIKLAFAFLEKDLRDADIEVGIDSYVSKSIQISVAMFFGLGISSYMLLETIGKGEFIFFSISVIFLISILFFLQRMYYPKALINRRIRDIEKNLMPALNDISVQLESGIPLFNILSNISNGQYGKVSKEFKIAVKEINAGKSQIEALDSIASRNPSLFFRRAVWQIVNALKQGSNLKNVISNSIDALSEEQLIQISSYGSQLKSISLFYMLIAVITPTLGLTIIILISYLLALPNFAILVIITILFHVNLFLQVMFIGVIKTQRPNLLGG